jgi:hypothetical protein
MHVYCSCFSKIKDKNFLHHLKYLQQIYVKNREKLIERVHGKQITVSLKGITEKFGPHSRTAERSVLTYPGPHPTYL